MFPLLFDLINNQRYMISIFSNHYRRHENSIQYYKSYLVKRFNSKFAHGW